MCVYKMFTRWKPDSMRYGEMAKVFVLEYMRRSLPEKVVDAAGNKNESYSNMMLMAVLLMMMTFFKKLPSMFVW